MLEEGENSSSSSEFDDVFDINYDVSQGAIGQKGMIIRKVWELQAN